MLRRVALALGCGLVLFAILIALLRRDVRVAIGTPLVYDDFGFTVLSVRDESSLLGCELVPKGVFRLVELEIRNDAKRVDYEVTGHRIILVDRQGVRHQVDAPAQRAYDASLAEPPPRVLHPTESCRTTLAFDVPKGSSSELGVTWSNSFFDTLDWILTGERRVELR